MASDKRIITIDGPAGAGKSTLARALAIRLGWTYLDTGAMYRAVGLAVYEAGLDVSDEKSLTKVMAELDLEVAPGRETTRIFLEGRDVTARIRAPHVSTLASAASALGVVRRAMVDIQRQLGEKGRVVAEGRDVGTVVFPGAGIKFFLEASLEERARRRFEELRAQGVQAALEDVTREMAERDKADSTRDLAPLRPAPDAIRIDSTHRTIEEVLDEMLSEVRKNFDLKSSRK